MKRFFNYAVIMVFVTCLIQTAGATTIDLGVATGTNEWEYVFTITNKTELNVTAFSFFFGTDLYNEVPSYTSNDMPLSWDIPDDWSIRYTNPYDNFFGELFSGELRIFTYAGLAQDDVLTFTVSFNWIDIADDVNPLSNIEDSTFKISAYDPISEAYYYGIDVVHGEPQLPSGVPEPQALVLLGTGLLGLAAYYRRNRSRK